MNVYACSFSVRSRSFTASTLAQNGTQTDKVRSEGLGEKSMAKNKQKREEKLASSTTGSC